MKIISHSFYRPQGGNKIVSPNELILEMHEAQRLETRAWTIHAGWKAPQAAGVIHSDFEKSFISADTIGYDELVSLGSFAKAREVGKLRTEGKEYVVQDGDIINFRFAT